MHANKTSRTRNEQRSAQHSNIHTHSHTLQQQLSRRQLRATHWDRAGNISVGQRERETVRVRGRMEWKKNVVKTRKQELINHQRPLLKGNTIPETIFIEAVSPTRQNHQYTTRTLSMHHKWTLSVQFVIIRNIEGEPERLGDWQLTWFTFDHQTGGLIQRLIFICAAFYTTLSTDFTS